MNTRQFSYTGTYTHLRTLSTKEARYSSAFYNTKPKCAILIQFLTTNRWIIVYSAFSFIENYYLISYNATTSILVSVEIGRQVRLLCPWARHLTELPLPFEW